MALRLIVNGWSWRLAQRTNVEGLRRDIENAMKTNDPLTVNLAGNGRLILNGERLDTVSIFDEGPADKRKRPPVSRVADDATGPASGQLDDGTDSTTHI
jgi:hypothetical protein